MAELVRGNTIGSKLCALFGVDPKGARRLTIDVPSNGLVTVTVERTVLGKEADAFVDLMSAGEVMPILMYKAVV